MYAATGGNVKEPFEFHKPLIGENCDNFFLKNNSPTAIHLSIY